MGTGTGDPFPTQRHRDSLGKRGSACAGSKGSFAGLDENQGVLAERRVFAGLAEDQKSRAEVGCAPRADALLAGPKT